MCGASGGREGLMQVGVCLVQERGCGGGEEETRRRVKGFLAETALKLFLIQPSDLPGTALTHSSL